MRRSRKYRLRLELLEVRLQPTAVPFFEPPAINGSFDGAASVFTADLDDDGDLDVLAAAFNAGEIAWWENVAGDGSAWLQRTIDSSFGEAISVHAADLDGDGDLDVLGAARLDDDIHWWENTNGNGTAWTEHSVDDAFDGAYCVSAADLDSDGDLDVLGAAVNDHDITWWENFVGDGMTWVEHGVDGNFQGATSVQATDIDGDGDLDVLGAATIDNEVAWWENLVGNGFTWTKHSIKTGFDTAFRAQAADIDGDGDLDVLGAALFGDDITWFENSSGNGTSWLEHTVDPAFTGPTGVQAADVDADGDLDILGAASVADDFAWWENTAGNGSAWTKRIVDGATDGAFDIQAADLDGDGDLDLLTAAIDADDVTWFRNDTIHHSAAFGPRSIISLAAEGAFDAVAADVDGDGDADVISASADDNTIAWYANLDGTGTFGAQQVIFASAIGAVSVKAADLDGDGDIDVLACSSLDDRVLWFRNLDGAGTFGGPEFISTFVDGPFSVATADVDGDGDLDVLSASINDDKIAWYMNMDGNGAFGFQQIISTAGDMPYAVHAADVDGDGDIDVLTASSNDDKFAWHENVAGNGTAWVEHIIPTTGDEGRAIYAADVDADGDLDIIGAFYKDDRIVWLENTAGTGLAWTQHNVSTTALGAYSVFGGDLDGDGDLDILSASNADDTIAWYESDGAPNPAFTEHIITTATNGAKSVVAADIDGDGDLDVVSASSYSGFFGSTDAIDWFENRGGQFALPTTNTAPTFITNGATDDILKIVATHRGRTGDHDAELATLDLLFEATPGNSLTSAQANAMIAKLFVYRDTNANGTWEASDSVVTEVDTLSLTTGRQTVPFTDGDPNVQLVFGTSKTFFVVVELTGNANEQPPGKFRVTHLTDSTSTGEDRVADIPLTLEFTGNVSSTIILAQVQPDCVGIVRTSTNEWAQDADNNHTPDDAPFPFDDRVGAIPVRGDWDGDGFDEVGTYLAGGWRLDSNANHVFDVGVDAEFTYGTLKDKPVAGDWDGDGRDEIGLYKKGKWTLDDNGDHIFNDVAFKYKAGNALGVVGDWDGDGRDEVGLFKKGKWTRDTNGDRLKNDIVVIYSKAQKGTLPVVGDWDADGDDDIGHFLAGHWTLDDGDLILNAALDTVFAYGQLGDVPFVGKWRTS